MSISFKEAYKKGTLRLKGGYPFRIFAWPGEFENPLNRIYGIYQSPSGNKFVWYPTWWYLNGKTPNRRDPKLDLIMEPPSTMDLMYRLQRFTWKVSQGSGSRSLAKQLNTEINCWLRLNHDQDS